MGWDGTAFWTADPEAICSHILGTRFRGFETGRSRKEPWECCTAADARLRMAETEAIGGSNERAKDARLIRTCRGEPGLLVRDRQMEGYV